MRSLFRTFDRARVRYLVIDGQASILYGAAFFSQDLDLWVEPTPANVRAFLACLRRLRARVHKLTPPPTMRNLHRGHGFHFRLPQRGSPDLYLDVMGQPPRAGLFAPARRRSVRIPSPWGTLPVVAIEDLVETKKTNRPADYDVISRLALIRLSREKRPRAALLRWALRNVFRAEDLWSIVSRFGSRRTVSLFAELPAASSLLIDWRARHDPTLRELSQAAHALARRAQACQDAGRAYWIPRLAELRRLRACGLLLPAGTAPSEGPP